MGDCVTLLETHRTTQIMRARGCYSRERSAGSPVHLRLAEQASGMHAPGTPRTWLELHAHASWQRTLQLLATLQLTRCPAFPWAVRVASCAMYTLALGAAKLLRCLGPDEGGPGVKTARGP